MKTGRNDKPVQDLRIFQCHLIAGATRRRQGQDGTGSVGLLTKLTRLSYLSITQGNFNGRTVDFKRSRWPRVNGLARSRTQRISARCADPNQSIRSMKERSVEPHLFIILGATGDLTRRKLLPALFHLRTYGELERQNTLIVGAALPELSQEAFRLWAYEGLTSSGARNATDLRQWCDEHVHYHTVREGGVADYEALAKFIAHLEVARNLPQNRIFYLALPRR